MKHCYTVRYSHHKIRHKITRLSLFGRWGPLGKSVLNKNRILRRLKLRWFTKNHVKFSSLFTVRSRVRCPNTCLLLAQFSSVRYLWNFQIRVRSCLIIFDRCSCSFLFLCVTLPITRTYLNFNSGIRIWMWSARIVVNSRHLLVSLNVMSLIAPAGVNVCSQNQRPNV